jgi:DMSO/TMAO reductase YedYZ molybdopterin-dependent catalytic subunit
MKTDIRRAICYGGLIGMLLTTPLVAIFYLGYRLAGLPFVPFNIFDWATRILPGAVISAGIDTMVHVIRWLNLGATSTAAKIAEQIIAIAGFVLIGISLGAILFGVMRYGQRKFAFAIGLIASCLFGLGALRINRSIDQTGTADPAASGLWIMTLFLAWGAALGWVYGRLKAEGEAVAADPDRRLVFRLAVAAAVISLAGAALGRMARERRQSTHSEDEPWSADHPLPNAGAPVAPAPGTRLEFTPLSQHYRIDINTAPPVIRAESWQLKIYGLVQRPLALTLDDLRRREPMHQFITLSCISNTVGGDLIGTTRWTGVSLKHILSGLDLLPNATHLKIRSADGFYEIVALETIHADERVMLAYAWDGLLLAPEHGFPLRIYIPDRYGMKQPKWIESIEVTDHWEPGYWVARGWDKEARMKATSVIDTIATNMMLGQANHETRVPIGGIAHAGVRGISKVEIRVDDGDWRQASLRAPLSGQTWVIWRHDWPLQRGKHTFTVRCFDGSGAPQIAEEAPPHPSGASGLHTRSAML